MVLVHSIEIATFELFSSVPEVFAVYTSSRCVCLSVCLSVCASLYVLCVYVCAYPRVRMHACVYVYVQHIPRWYFTATL